MECPISPAPCKRPRTRKKRKRKTTPPLEGHKESTEAMEQRTPPESKAQSSPCLEVSPKGSDRQGFCFIWAPRLRPKVSSVPGVSDPSRHHKGVRRFYQGFAIPKWESLKWATDHQKWVPLQTHRVNRFWLCWFCSLTGPSHGNGFLWAFLVSVWKSKTSPFLAFGQVSKLLVT